MFVGAGTLLNFILVLCGSWVGLRGGRFINPKIKEGITVSIGLFTLLLGIKLITENKPDILKVFLILVVGGALGYLLDIEGRILRVSGNGSKDTLKAFISSSLIFTVGPMTLIGCILEGAKGDSSLIMSKAVMDGFSSVLFASSMGKGVMYSAFYILLFQGTITFLAYLFGDFIDKRSLANTLFVGGGMMIMISLSLWGILKNISIVNMMPSLIIALFL